MENDKGIDYKRYSNCARKTRTFH